jgi:hypothetical protein
MMRVCFARHARDEAFVQSVVDLMSAHRMERHATPDGSDVVVLVASASALYEGLGDEPERALESGVPLLPVVLGEALVPRRFPAARKHVPLVSDAASMLRLLEDHRKNASAKIADGKRELFGYGLLLAMLARR